MENVATRILALPHEKRALLLQKLPPLSFSQQRLWELEASARGAANVMVLPVRLSGPLNREALAESLTELARRHEVLRTIFPTLEGRPVPVVLPPAQIPLPVLDLSRYPLAEQEVKELIGQAMRERFDFERGPLWRTMLLSLSPEEQIVLLSAHQMIFDGYSIGVLLGEVGQLYESYSERIGPRLPDLPAQYGDYARWQRELLSGEVLERQIDYWRTQLREAPPLPELATDFPRPPAWQAFSAASLAVHCDAGASLAIKNLCVREGVTLFMAGVAAFAAFLHARTSLRDFIVGVPLAGRSLAATEGMIGSFVNLILLRIKLSANMRGTDLLAQVRATTLAAYDHQELPFAKLLEELYPGEEYDSYGVRGGAPLFRVVFDFKNKSTTTSLALRDLKISLVEMEDKMTGCDLYVKLWEEQQLVKGSVLYNRELFHEETAVRMVAQYKGILERLAVHPSLRLPELVA